MKLLILGNGFDLASGLPTKYRDFFENLIEINSHKFLKVEDFLNNKISSTAKDSCLNLHRIIRNGEYSLSGKSLKSIAEEEFQQSIEVDKSNIDDLYNNFLTDYVVNNFDFWSFLFWIKNKKDKNNKEWYEVELEIKEFLISICKDDTKEIANNNYKILDSDFLSILKVDSLSYYPESNFSDILEKTETIDKLDALLFKYFFYLKKINNNDIFYGLYIELTKFENKFKNYINEILFNFVQKDVINSRIYRDNFVELIKHNFFHDQYSILNFNYTSFTENPYSDSDTQQITFRRDNQDITINESNIHGNYRKISIFGIDQKDVGTKSPLYQFTKTYRKMIDQDKISRFTLPNIDTIDEIVFFGHSLSDADYSYFQSIFDYYNIYQSNIKLSFCYSEYGSEDQFNEIRRKLINSVSVLLNKYGKTIGNNDRGENLIHKLLLENRLGYRIIKFNKVNTSKLYFALKEYREKKAKELKLRPSDILNHNMIISIIQEKPKEIVDLKRIKGLNEKKILIFGKDIIDLIITNQID